MMHQKLVLEDREGKIVRTYSWNGEDLKVVRRGDSRRLELVGSLEALELKQIPFELLGEINALRLQSGGFAVGEMAHLRLLPQVGAVAMDTPPRAESSKIWQATLGLIFILATGLLIHLFTRPEAVVKNEEAMKQEVIKIIKKIPPRQQKVALNPKAQQDQPTKTAKDTPKSPDRIKRMGALGVLGSLNKSRQKGGLDLGAVNTTAGPGLGGTQGSGGVQTSLYAKGLTSAALGAGGKVEGAGGYGTKGKGGGQAGYGQLSMVGSSGAMPVGLEQEASVDTGLDRDAIAAVINRNLGQVRFCYEQGLQSDPNLSGRVAVDFVIGGNGAVRTASVGNSSLNSKMIEDCILLRLRSWKFPLPQGGVDVKVSYPFVLRRTGQG